MTMCIALPYRYTPTNNPTEAYRYRLNRSIVAGTYFDDAEKDWVCFWANRNGDSMKNGVYLSLKEATDAVDAWLLSNDEYLL